MSMAASSENQNPTLQELKKLLTCSICLSNYTEPKILPCFHSFCLRCLAASVPLELAQPHGNHGYSLPCPTCRSPSLLPKQGVKALAPSFTINNLTKICNLLKKVSGNQHTCDNCSNTNADRYCKQCAKLLCQQCLHQHDKWIVDHQTLDLDEVVDTAYQLSRAKPDITSNCTNHSLPLEIFCQTCQELVCHLCMVKEHRDHEYDVVSDAYTKYKLKIESAILQPLNQQINRIVEAVADLVKRREEIADQGGKVKDEIHDEFAQIKKLLDQTEARLIEEVDVGLKYKLDVTDYQMKEAKAVLDQLTECSNHVQLSQKVDTLHEVLSAKSRITTHAENLVSKAKDQMFMPSEQANIKFERNSEVAVMIASFGKIQYVTTTTPTSVISSYQHIPLVHQLSTIKISLSHSPIPVPSSLIRLRLSPPDSKGSIRCTVKESSQSGQYNVTFTPNARGVHQLFVTIHYNNLPSSPLRIPVSIPPKMRGSPVNTIGTGLNKPTGVATLGDGQVIVCESVGHCITVIDRKGRKVKSFGSHGNAKGQLSLPADIAITSKGTLLVVDRGNNRVQEFTMDGKCVSCVGSKGDGPLQFYNPCSMAISKATGQVYVVEFTNRRVQVLNADLTFSHTFGSHGSGRGQFNDPCGINVDSQGFVYVADSKNNRIQQFTPEGKWLSSFGTKGSEPGQLTLPCDITVDDNDLLYICEDVPNCRVSVFTTNGEFVHCFGKGIMGYPCKSVFDVHGLLYVCDYNDGNVKVF